MPLPLTDQRRLRLRIALAFLFAAALASFFLFGGERLLSLDVIKQNRDELMAYTQAHYGRMLVICALVYMASTAFSLPGGAVLSLGMGLLFGRWVGTLLTVVASTVGATLVFWAARFVFADTVRQRLARYPSATRILDGFQQDAFHYLLFLRLVPLFPFWLVNLVPAITRIDTRTYFWATIIGIIPGSFVYVNLGQSLGEINSARDLLSFEVALSFTLLGVFALLPVFFKKAP
jgi:uncharacterized membrane protein YdjX (TVP38/TMEM64 family)